MWLCSAVERCPRGWSFPDHGTLESIYVTHPSIVHSTQTPESVMVMLLSILQGNIIPTPPRMTVVSTHPQFLVSIAKIWATVNLG